MIPTPEDLEVLKIIEAALMKRWPENKIEPSLDRISALVDALGSPQISFRWNKWQDKYIPNG